MKKTGSLIFILSLALLFDFTNVSAGDTDLPEKGKETTVKCVEFPDISYKVLIPQEYDPAKPCAIIYTFSPGGGGMVGAHKSANEITPTIIVGINGSRNGAPEMDFIGEIYAVMWDTLSRFNIDPAAQYSAGFSGGAVESYTLARQNKERIGGVMASGGWLQNMYDPWFFYPKGLQVARSNGEDDKSANSWCDKDMSHLKKEGCNIKDWRQPGGHNVATPENIKSMMQWFVSGKPDDKTTAKAQEKAARWKETPYSPASIKEILDTIKTSPRTKLCNLAMLELFDIMKDDDKFCKITIPSSANGPELTGFFGYLAYGAALSNDSKRFRSATFALDKVCQDRNSKWGGIIGALYFFSPGGDTANSKQGLLFIEKYTKSKNIPLYNQLVLSAGLLKNGKKAEAKKIADKINIKTDEQKLTPLFDNLKKALKEGETALDSQIWIKAFGEGD